jgi:hypothetical protein
MRVAMDMVKGDMGKPVGKLSFVGSFVELQQELSFIHVKFKYHFMLEYRVQGRNTGCWYKH